MLIHITKPTDTSIQFSEGFYANFFFEFHGNVQSCLSGSVIVWKEVYCCFQYRKSKIQHKLQKLRLFHPRLLIPEELVPRK